MAVPKKLFKVYTAFKGLDLRSSDLLRESDASTGLTNVLYRQTGAMSKRNGYQLNTDDTAGYGLTTYRNIDTTTGAKTNEVIGIDDNLYIKTDYTFGITYSGSEVGVYYKIYLDTSSSKFYFDLYEDNARVLNRDLGTGVEVSFVTIDNLRTSITAITGFTAAAATGAASKPAAFIPVTAQVDLSAGSGTVTYQDWLAIDTPSSVTNPFSTFYAQRTDANFENATFAQLNNVLYIATGHDAMHKYDSNRVYAAGLPRATITSVADTGSGSTFAQNEVYDYKVEYVTRDAKGNEHTGQISLLDAHTVSAANSDITVTIPYIQASSGYNTDQAVVSGAQSTVSTITVDSGHNIKAGDRIYIDDGVTSTVVNREVASTTSTTVVISGDTVTVGDNDIISNIKLTVLRTNDYAGAVVGAYYFNKEIVNDSSTASIGYVDQITDANLGEQYAAPIKVPALPPTCRYIDNWRGFLVAAGDKTAVDTWYYSDVNKPEAFDPDSSSIVSQKITGLQALNNVTYIFQDNNIDGVTGDLVDDKFQVDPLSRDGIGCAAHHTIQAVKGKLIFLSDTGVFSIDTEGVEQIGAPIEPRFAKGNPFTFKQAVAFNWNAKNAYLLFMPSLTVDASYSDDDNNDVYVLDYFRNAWLQWDNFNFMGGITEIDKDVLMSRRTSTRLNLQKVLQDGLETDYADHVSGISFSFKSHWETMGEPSIWKKFLRAKIHSYDTSIGDFEGNTFSVTLKTENDYSVNTVTNISYDFSAGESGWGNDPWGAFRWGQDRLTQIKKRIASKKVRSMRVIFENSTAHQNVLISGYELEVAVPYQAGLKE